MLTLRLLLMLHVPCRVCGQGSLTACRGLTIAHADGRVVMAEEQSTNRLQHCRKRPCNTVSVVSCVNQWDNIQKSGGQAFVFAC